MRLGANAQADHRLRAFETQQGGTGSVGFNDVSLRVQGKAGGGCRIELRRPASLELTAPQIRVDPFQSRLADLQLLNLLAQVRSRAA